MFDKITIKELKEEIKISTRSSKTETDVSDRSIRIARCISYYDSEFGERKQLYH